MSLLAGPDNGGGCDCGFEGSGSGSATFLSHTASFGSGAGGELVSSFTFSVTLASFLALASSSTASSFVDVSTFSGSPAALGLLTSAFSEASAGCSALFSELSGACPALALALSLSASGEELSSACSSSPLEDAVSSAAPSFFPSSSGTTESPSAIFLVSSPSDGVSVPALAPSSIGTFFLEASTPADSVDTSASASGVFVSGSDIAQYSSPHIGNLKLHSSDECICTLRVNTAADRW